MLLNKLRKITLAAVSLVTIAILAAGCGSSDKKEEKGAASSNGKTIVKIAHEPDYMPYCYIGADKKSDGFEVAMMREINKLLPQYEFQFIATSNDDLLIGVNTGKYDAGIKGAWYTSARKDKYIFPKHYIAASTIGITFRSEDKDKIKDMESFARAGGKLVPIAPQNAQYAVVDSYNKKHPDNQVKLLPSENFIVADAYTWVLEGRYDGYLSIELAYVNNVVKETGQYHKFADKLAYIRHEAIPTYPLFNKKRTQLAADYDAAMEKLQKTGIIKELEMKYLGEDVFQYVKSDGKEER